MISCFRVIYCIKIEDASSAIGKHHSVHSRKLKDAYFVWLLRALFRMVLVILENLNRVRSVYHKIEASGFKINDSIRILYQKT